MYYQMLHIINVHDYVYFEAKLLLTRLADRT